MVRVKPIQKKISPTAGKWIHSQITLFWEGINRFPWREPRRRLYDNQLVYCSEGDHLLCYDDREYKMTAGTIGLIPPATWHESVLGKSDRTHRHCILFNWFPRTVNDAIPIQVFEGEDFDVRHEEPLPVPFEGKLPFYKRLDTEELRLVEMLFSALRKRQGVGLGLLDALLNHWLAEKAPDNLRVLHREKDASLALKNYLESSYADTGGYRDFCAIAGLSPSHLCRSFKKAYRMTPTQYLIQLRLTHARSLISSGRPIAEAALAVGIRDANYFARLFRKNHGLSPTQIA